MCFTPHTIDDSHHELCHESAGESPSADHSCPVWMMRAWRNGWRKTWHHGSVIQRTIRLDASLRMMYNTGSVTRKSQAGCTGICLGICLGPRIKILSNFYSWPWGQMEPAKRTPLQKESCAIRQEKPPGSSHPSRPGTLWPEMAARWPVVPALTQFIWLSRSGEKGHWMAIGFGCDWFHMILVDLWHLCSDTTHPSDHAWERACAVHKTGQHVPTVGKRRRWSQHVATEQLNITQCSSCGNSCGKSWCNWRGNSSYNLFHNSCQEIKAIQASPCPGDLDHLGPSRSDDVGRFIDCSACAKAGPKSFFCTECLQHT